MLPTTIRLVIPTEMAHAHLCIEEFPKTILKPALLSSFL